MSDDAQPVKVSDFEQVIRKLFSETDKVIDARLQQLLESDL